MGVTGLWRLIEPAGKPVPVETLENKVLAVDISIWLHQMVKGYQDAKGAPLPNAHLIGLFQRLCKLLYFRVKPVFVFDGAYPDLKKETIAKRQDNKNKYNSESERIKRELALILSKKTAIGSLLGKQISPKKNAASTSKPAIVDDIFKLPALPARDESESESEDEDSSSGSIVDLHSVDVESDNFKQLPVKEKYNLLIDLKETRKMNSWGKLHELPKKSDNFSDFQLQRLLKRRKVQEVLEETEKEMGDGCMSLNELESLLNEEGIDTKIEALPTRRIASNNTTRFLLINNVKQAIEDAKKKNLEANKISCDTVKEIVENEPKVEKKNELEDDLQRAIKMSLECVDANDSTSKDLDTSNCTSKTDDSWTSNFSDSDHFHYDSEDGDVFDQPDMTSAKAYIMQYSDFTHKAIDQLVSSRNKDDQSKQKAPNVDKIIEELNKEKSIIAEELDISSGDEDGVKSKVNIHNISLKIETDSSDEDSLRIETSETTQSSVIVIEKPKQEIISLDTSTDDNIEGSFTNTASKDLESSSDDDFKEVPEKNKPACKSVHNINLKIEPDSSDEDTLGIETSEATQSSIIVINNPTQEIVSLDTSTDDNIEGRFTNTASKDLESSSDDDFEEVPEKDKPACKNVVELTLDIGGKPEDDIFADVFICNKDIELKTTTENVKSKPDDCIPDSVTKKGLANMNTSTELTDDTNIQGSNDYKTDLNVSNEMQSSISKYLHMSRVENEFQNVKDDFKAPLPASPNRNQENRVLSSAEPHSSSSAAPTKSVQESIINVKSTMKSIEVCYGKEIDSGLENKGKTVAETDVYITEENIQPKEIPPTICRENLNNMVNEMENVEQDLLQEKGRLDRVGRNITEQMTKEAQELLQIFGIPYIVAPMEAEAQCAFLEATKLTDGTITDDSDIWLFGGKTVYKNFFNQKKHVLQFLSERIEKSFNLTREHLVLLALLVGSDYTTGLTGVGPVTALEILASFPYNRKKFLNEDSKQDRYREVITGLQEFKKWVRTGKKTDNTTLKKKLKNVDVSDDFPSIRVVQAYLDPNVEKSEENFTWGEIDVTVLRDYTRAKFGWSQNKLDEIIKPVLKRLEDRKSQRNIHDYFKKKIEFQSLEEHMSKRVKDAVQKMGPEDLLRLENAELTTKKAARKRKPKGDKNTEDSSTDAAIAGPSKAKQKKANETTVLADLGVKVVSKVREGKSSIEITIPKTDRVQEMIPQREKDKHSLLQNKMKAIEIFRKSKLDQKKKTKKRKAILPKAKAELSESDSD